VVNLQLKCRRKEKWRVKVGVECRVGERFEVVVVDFEAGAGEKEAKKQKVVGKVGEECEVGVGEKWEVVVKVAEKCEIVIKVGGEFEVGTNEKW
jgi:hypothetical protein